MFRVFDLLAPLVEDSGCRNNEEAGGGLWMLMLGLVVVVDVGVGVVVGVGVGVVVDVGVGVVAIGMGVRSSISLLVFR